MLSLNSKGGLSGGSGEALSEEEDLRGELLSVVTDKSRDFRETRHKYLIEIRQVRRLNL